MDVTERKRLEQQLHQAQKMEAVGTLAGGLAHDFNNLLMAIQGRVSLMLTDIVADPREHLLAIEEYVRSASELTTRLLGVARGGKYEVARTDINELVRDSLSLFGRTKKELRTHSDYVGEALVAEVDRRQLEQVLLNLWVNAWQAMPGGGDLYVETGRVELDASQATAHDVEPGSFVRIQVRDTGSGMSDEVRERVFEPFFTTKEMGRGTGLGLASAYGIVRNHGGCIAVESAPGEGSTFTILLPRANGAVERSSESPVGVAHGRGTILLIDDERVVREVCASLLERIGYDVIQAESGEEGLRLFREQPRRFDLVILDLVMPGRQGPDVFDSLVEVDEDVRILIASGYSVEGDASALLERGALGFLQKPFNLEQLSEKLQEVLA
jgi:nitrogen-specific signal transduction histidine kinase